MKIEFVIMGKPRRWERPAERTFPGKRPMRYIKPEVQAASDRIRDEAKRHWTGPPSTGPVVLGLTAVFEIPKSWPKYLREKARQGEVMHIQDPDYDQLVKLVMDALRGVVFVDDNQVCGFLPASCKRYGFPERTVVVVQTLPQHEAAVTPGQRRLEKKADERAELIREGKLGRKANPSRSKS